MDAGVDADEADIISEAAGLTGPQAEVFIADKDLVDFTITWAEQLKLFEVATERLNGIREACNERVQRKYGVTDWENLDETIQEMWSICDIAAIARRVVDAFTTSCRP